MTILQSRQLARLEQGVKGPLAVQVLPDTAAQRQKAGATGKALAMPISEVLRLLPGKRLVGITDWQGEKAIVKLFFHRRRWSRHLRREVAGFRLAESYQIPVPDLLATGALVDRQGGFLISRFLEQGASLEQLLENQVGQLDNSIAQAVRLIAHCHRQGLWHQDIHLGNFMVIGDQVYMLDCSEFRTETPGAALSESARLSNLALFFAQLPVSRDRDVGRLLNVYDSELPEALRSGDVERMQDLICKAREKRMDKYLAKLFRGTSAFYRERTRTYRMLCDRNIMSSEFSAFSRNPDAYMERGEILKAGNTTTVALVTIDGRKYVLKRYNIKGLVHGLRRMVKASRASRSWQAGLLLEMLGVATAKPLMMLERRVLWMIRRESYILFEYIEGDTVPQVLASEKLTPQLREGIFSNFQRFFELMRQYRFSHGDLKATNFIYNNDRLIVLDLDATQRHRDWISFNRAFTKDLHRFVRMFSEEPELQTMQGRAQDIARAVGE
jgi:tRNA A-37 threonylcarbamoyl transferase component Bud32